LRLRDDKEMARFRILTPGRSTEGCRKVTIEGKEVEETLINAEFHNIKLLSSKGTPFWKNVMCTLDPETGEGKCQYNLLGMRCIK